MPQQRCVCPVDSIGGQRGYEQCYRDCSFDVNYLQHRQWLLVGPSVVGISSLLRMVCIQDVAAETNAGASCCQACACGCSKHNSTPLRV
jgi:hypothetical protein